jgi:hypothetical protein
VTVPTIGISDPTFVSLSSAAQVSRLAAYSGLGANVGYIRIDASWDQYEGAGSGTYHWNLLDIAINNIATQSTLQTLLIMNGQCPSWSSYGGSRTTGDTYPSGSTGQSQFAAYCATAANRYKNVSFFEIWNEPNGTQFWGSPSAANYTATLKAAANAIRASNSKAAIISAGLSPEDGTGGSITPVNFLSGMYTAGAKGYMDAVGMHPYCYPNLPNAYALWSGWSQMNATPTSLRSVMLNAGDSATPLWVTEFGGPTATPVGVGYTTTQQATAFTQAIADAKAASYITGFFVYEWIDARSGDSNTEDNFGLVLSSGDNKPAFTAVKNAIA